MQNTKTMPSKKSRFLNFDKNKKLNNTSSVEIYSNCNGESANLFAGLNGSPHGKSNNILANNFNNTNNLNSNNSSNFSTNVKVININYNEKPSQHQHQQQQQQSNNFDSSIKPVDCNNCSNNYLVANDTNNSIYNFSLSLSLILYNRLFLDIFFSKFNLFILPINK